MRIGIPVWEGKVSPVLDTALKLQVVEVENQKVASRSLYHMNEHDLNRRCARIRGMEVDTIICGAISHPFLRMLMASGIHVIREISGTAEDVLETYLQGKLFDSNYIMPWCKRNQCKGNKQA